MIMWVLKVSAESAVKEYRTSGEGGCWIWMIVCRLCVCTCCMCRRVYLEP